MKSASSSSLKEDTAVLRLHSSPESGISGEFIYAELNKLRESIVDKDKEICRLRRETNKLRSVIEKSELTRIPSLSAYQPGGSGHQKKCGVSGESSGDGEPARLPEPERYYKDFRSRQLIRSALGENDFLKNLETDQVRDIVDFMHEQSFHSGDFVICEGEAGSNLYVSAEGQLEIIQGNKSLGVLGPGKVIGELAILYNCTRTASVRALTECKVWALERRAFQFAMMKAGIQRIKDRLVFLKTVPLLRGIDTACLSRIADSLEVACYSPGSYIIREKEAGDTFFIIKDGKVCVTTSEDPTDESDPSTAVSVIRELSRGDYFGEQALLKEEMRSANVISMPPTGVELLTLDRESFLQLIGGLSEFNRHRKAGPSPFSSKQNISYLSCHPHSSSSNLDLVTHQHQQSEHLCQGQQNACQNQIQLGSSVTRSGQGHLIRDDEEQLSTACTALTPTDGLLDDDGFELEHLTLDDLDVVSTLGIGGFGRVALVQISQDSNRVFALKCLPKVHILATQQQEHVFSEKNIMLMCKSPFICRLYKTFKDSKFVYLLMEALLGGEVWSILRDRGNFDEDTTRFIAACVLLALEYLHDRRIVYRDLKPENLMLANDGYVKLVDFGFSKIVPNGQRTWTFCGTPEYCAPEIILNRGHDAMVDFWSLGILLFELLTGLPPWGPMSENAPTNDSSDPLTTYNAILKGIESINFTKNLSRASVSLIRRLCRQSPGERLGANRGIRDVTSHRWYQGFDWDGIRNRRLKPPLAVNLRHPQDTSAFDRFPTEIEDTPNDFSGWDDEF